MAKKQTAKTIDTLGPFSSDEYQIVRVDNNPSTFHVVPIKQDKVLRAVAYLNGEHSKEIRKLLKPMQNISHHGLDITVSLDVNFGVFLDYDDDNIRYNKTKKIGIYPEFDSWSTNLERPKVINQVRASDEYKQAEAKITAIRDAIIKGVEDLLAKDTEITHDLTPKQLNDVIQKLVD